MQFTNHLKEPSMTNRTAMPDEVGLPGRHFNTWTYIAKTAEGEDIDAVMTPSFWAHLAKKFKAGDRVEILADNGKWEIQCRIMRGIPGGVLMREVFRWEDDGKVFDAPVPLAASVAWGGPNHKWRVTSGDQVIKHGFSTEAEAQDWMARKASGLPDQQAA